MNRNQRPIRTTMIYGLFCALIFMPAIVMIDTLNMIDRQIGFRLIIWAFLAGYSLFLTRWGQISFQTIIFPLLLPLIFVFTNVYENMFFLLALGVLAWIRSGLSFPGPVIKTMGAEASIGFGSAFLVAHFAPQSLLAWSLGIWMFFLGQAVYFIIFAGHKKSDAARTNEDVFESAKRRAEEILSA
jgi:hypothetical protein